MALVRLPGNVAAILLCAIVSPSWISLASGQNDAELKLRGHSILANNCSRCHSIELTGNSTHPEAPPFRTLGQRYPVEWLAEALAEGLSTGHPDMPEFTFELHDVDAILAYLQSIQIPKPAQKR